MSRVLLITNIPAPYRVDLFKYLQRNQLEHEYHVIYTSQNEENRMWTIKEECLENTTILNSKVIKIKGKNDDRFVHIPGNLSKEIQKVNPDVVIAWEYNPSAIQALLWCKIHKKKFIHLTDGTLFSERNIGFIQKITRRIIISNADAYIASSSKAKEKLVAWGAKEKSIFMSLLTVDISPYRNAVKNGTSNTILYVGRIIRGKGLDLLINALSEIKCDYQLHIVGNGSDDQVAELKQQANMLGVDSKIEWLGFKSGHELVDEYVNAGAFVLPTREDCFGLVLLEALCSSTPIVSSKYADGSYDIVSAGKNGFIVDPEKTTEFARAIETIIDNKEVQRRFSENCKANIEKFEFKEVTKGYKQAIDYVLTRRNE